MLSVSNTVNVYNTVGARVWELCDGTRSVNDVVDVIVGEYDVDRARAQADVVAFIEELVADRALELLDARRSSLPV